MVNQIAASSCHSINLIKNMSRTKQKRRKNHTQWFSINV